MGCSIILHLFIYLRFLKHLICKMSLKLLSIAFFLLATTIFSPFVIRGNLQWWKRWQPVLAVINKLWCFFSPSTSASYLVSSRMIPPINFLSKQDTLDCSIFDFSFPQSLFLSLLRLLVPPTAEPRNMKAAGCVFFFEEHGSKFSAAVNKLASKDHKKKYTKSHQEVQSQFSLEATFFLY